ncbi:hypothetical protein GCM10025794_04160 [Massilia kyonggiensis]
MKRKTMPVLIAALVLGMTFLAPAHAQHEHLHPTAVQTVADVTFTLRTDISDGKLVFMGDAGKITGKANPTLNVPVGAVVQINLVNGDGATHDLGVADFGVKSNQLNDKGASTAIVFRATKKGTFDYICTLPGHVQAGMIGKIVVGEGAADTAPKAADISRDPRDLPPPVGKRAPQHLKVSPEQNYALVDRSDAQKRAVKARLFQELKDEYQVLKGNWGGYAGYDRFFEQPLSNAHLASIATYEDFVPAFRALLQREGSFPKFYNAVKRLADMDRSDRHRVLNALVPPLVTAPLMVQRSEIRP